MAHSPKEMKVPVNALCGSSCVSEYDVATQSLKLTRQNGRLAVGSVTLINALSEICIFHVCVFNLYRQTHTHTCSEISDTRKKNKSPMERGS
jgi:hypothetical protein